MARNGSGIYSLPAAYLAVTGETIEATQHNTPLVDIEADLNAARPIVAGGTGATSAAAARTALGLAIGTNVQAWSAALQAIADGSGSEGLDITGLTALTAPAIADEMAVYDASAAANRKVALSDLFKVINGITAQTTPVIADELVTYDNVGATSRKVTLGNLLKLITGLTAETAPATDDELALYDTSGGTADKITLATLFSVINVLTAETAPATGDKIAIYDASESAANSMTLENMLKVLNSLTEDTSPDSANDFLLTYDASASGVKKVKPSNLNVGGGLTFIATADAASDATIDFTQFDGATYDAYVFVLANVVPATDSVSFIMRTSTDGGATYTASASAYSRGAYGIGTAGALTSATTGLTGIQLTETNVGSAVGESGVSGVVWVLGPHLTGDTHIHASIGAKNFNGGFEHITVLGVRDNPEDTDAVRFLFSSGNIESGTITMYGMRNA